ncbi:hypothetical protein ABG768_007094 [Culter alburnus]|uniref:ADF-H domain-containing protein n=1 Tax=Culter alburnus TaxID=194366 RepID=A0AAW1ZNK6_CULAL
MDACRIRSASSSLVLWVSKELINQLETVSCKPEQQMMYAGSKNRLVQSADLTKIFEVRNPDDLTEEWLKEKLSFFR